jgi:N-glycosylase/DNA lyase
MKLRLAVPEPFDLRLMLFSHGWVDLPPHVWDADSGVLRTALRVARRPVGVAISQRKNALHVVAEPELDATARAELRASLRRMLRLDEDLSEFWGLCGAEPHFAWVARRGAGRLLRAPTLFEDLAKLLMTTNCSWAATRNMSARITEALGEKAPGGLVAFPSPARCTKKNADFYRDVVRMGYRAPFFVELARSFADGSLDDAHFDPRHVEAAELRSRLLALPGFGPYAAGQALRLLGCYEDLALDSWCRGKLARRTKSGRAPSDRTIAKSYRRFGCFQGLALWMDLTADWHGEAADVSPLAARPR